MWPKPLWTWRQHLLSFVLCLSSFMLFWLSKIYRMYVISVFVVPIFHYQSITFLAFIAAFAHLLCNSHTLSPFLTYYPYIMILSFVLSWFLTSIVDQFYHVYIDNISLFKHLYLLTFVISNCKILLYSPWVKVHIEHIQNKTQNPWSEITDQKYQPVTQELQVHTNSVLRKFLHLVTHRKKSIHPFIQLFIQLQIDKLFCFHASFVFDSS